MVAVRWLATLKTSMITTPTASAPFTGRRPWDDFRHVYPVVSRRTGGVSIGINLNPDQVCNFGCVYCEVDRRSSTHGGEVSLDTLANELRLLLGLARTGELFQYAPFVQVPPAWRRLSAIAFSGDGEPTTCPVFAQAMALAVRLRNENAPRDTKVVLITNSACLDRPGVQLGLHTLVQGAHEIWAKLDAGTESHFKTVNRSAVSYVRILQNLADTARRFPLFVQSLFLKVRGSGPTMDEIEAYCDQIDEVLAADGRILGLQLNTVARTPAESWAAALTNEELDTLARRIKQRNGLPQQLGYGGSFHVSRQAGRAARVAAKGPAS